MRRSRDSALIISLGKSMPMSNVLMKFMIVYLYRFFSLYKTKSKVFANSLKITVKRLSPCNKRLSLLQKCVIIWWTITTLSDHIAISSWLTKWSETFRMHSKCIRSYLVPGNQLIIANDKIKMAISRLFLTLKTLSV